MPQRTVKGTCALCRTAVDRRRSAVHYSACAAAHEVDTARGADLVVLRCTQEGPSLLGRGVAAGSQLPEDGCLRVRRVTSVAAGFAAFKWHRLFETEAERPQHRAKTYA